MEQPTPARGRLREAAEDATGFGAAELRLTRDLLVRPRAALLGQGDPAAGYPKAFRYFLALNGLYMLLIGLLGGFESALDQGGARLIDQAVAMSGKSRDGFLADLDQWYSLLAVPTIALSFYPPLRWLFGRWSAAPTGGQAFTFISAWTLWSFPLGLASVVFPSLQGLALASCPLIVGLLFHLMGRGVWWTTFWQEARRVVVLLIALAVAMALAAVVALTLAFLGAVWGP